ncbi:RALF domain-containing protein [Cephalotus follicularis]|uniref:RALF domain-containing protein n=1 Tax=Cephalotus follicularis TaxID=3775 RepID=A0A1Q3AT95_CEPFO|nr:RALF domain-containing protein [Cephalotus follicularis]
MSKPILLPNPMTTLYLVALILLQTHFSMCNGVYVFGLNTLKTSEINVMATRGCSEDCLTDAEMDSETSRRVLLMQKKYISYEALKRGMVPCARPGASYYDCHAAAANPYNRGCEVITRCARDIKYTRT